jgi:polyhydroxyalkanoate synthesis regulator phasin
MKRRLIGIPLAGLLLVGGATAAMAHGGLLGGPAEGGTILSEVLDELVSDGTINQSQADAIEEAITDRRTELREEAEARREQMRTFLEDGTLSADELAQLPEDHPLRNLDSFLEDGQLTQDELQQLRGFGRGPGFGRGHHGPFFGPDRDASDDSSDAGETSAS